MRAKTEHTIAVYLLLLSCTPGDLGLAVADVAAAAPVVDAAEPAVAADVSWPLRPGMLASAEGDAVAGAVMVDIEEVCPLAALEGEAVAEADADAMVMEPVKESGLVAKPTIFHVSKVNMAS